MIWPQISLEIVLILWLAFFLQRIRDHQHQYFDLIQTGSAEQTNQSSMVFHEGAQSLSLNNRKLVLTSEVFTGKKYMHLPSLTYFLRSFLLWKLTSSNSCSKALGDRVLTESTMELNLSQLTAIMTDCKECQIYWRSIIGALIIVWNAFKLIWWKPKREHALLKSLVII